MAAASLQKKLSQIRRKIRRELGAKLGAKLGVKNLGGAYLIVDDSGLALDTRSRRLELGSGSACGACLHSYSVRL